jgi:hypothetical protein
MTLAKTKSWVRIAMDASGPIELADTHLEPKFRSIANGNAASLACSPDYFRCQQ